MDRIISSIVFSVNPKFLRVDVICWRYWVIRLGSADGHPGTELKRKSNAPRPLPKFKENGVEVALLFRGPPTTLGVTDLWSPPPLLTEG